jgi:hypothetical protein
VAVDAGSREAAVEHVSPYLAGVEGDATDHHAFGVAFYLRSLDHGEQLIQPHRWHLVGRRRARGRNDG